MNILIKTGLLLALMSGSVVEAGQEMALNWSMSLLEFNGYQFDQLRLDVEQGPRFFRANGILADSRPQSEIIPIAGTCMVVATSETIMCRFDISDHVLELKFGMSLGGEYYLTKDNQGTVASGMVYYTGIQ